SLVGTESCIRDSSIPVDSSGLVSSLTDPLGLSIGNVADSAVVAEEQGVKAGTLTNMAALFGSQLAAFCYLVFVLLYAPCVATLGAISKEAGWQWMVLVFAWCTGLGYITASSIYQIGTLANHPTFSILWVAGCGLILIGAVHSLKMVRRQRVSEKLIEVVQVG
ncbi:MAG: ferrous iron transporter B, partial [Pseudomonadales bacterium]|nr:ferrous iron transporter B [Pseudomonadales bacterium]